MSLAESHFLFLGNKENSNLANMAIIKKTPKESDKQSVHSHSSLNSLASLKRKF